MFSDGVSDEIVKPAMKPRISGSLWAAIIGVSVFYNGPKNMGILYYPTIMYSFSLDQRQGQFQSRKSMDAQDRSIDQRGGSIQKEDLL